MNYQFIILFYVSILCGALIGVYLGFLILSSNKEKAKTKKIKQKEKKNKPEKPERIVDIDDEIQPIKKQPKKKKKTPLSKVTDKSSTVTYTDEQYGFNIVSKKNAIKTKMEKQDDAYNSVKKQKIKA